MLSCWISKSLIIILCHIYIISTFLFNTPKVLPFIRFEWKRSNFLTFGLFIREREKIISRHAFNRSNTHSVCVWMWYMVIISELIATWMNLCFWVCFNCECVTNVAISIIFLFTQQCLDRAYDAHWMDCVHSIFVYFSYSSNKVLSKLCWIVYC